MLSTSNLYQISPKAMQFATFGRLFFPRETTPSTPSRHKTTNRQNRQFRRGGPFRVLTRSVLCDNASVVPRGWRCEVTTEPGKFTQDGPFFSLTFCFGGTLHCRKTTPGKCRLLVQKELGQSKIKHGILHPPAPRLASSLEVAGLNYPKREGIKLSRLCSAR